MGKWVVNVLCGRCPRRRHPSGKIRVHYNDVIMSTMASQITSLTIVYSSVYPGADQRTHQSSALLAFVRGIHQWPVNSPHKGPVTRKIFLFDDVIMGRCIGERCPPNVCCAWKTDAFRRLLLYSQNVYPWRISINTVSGWDRILPKTGSNKSGTHTLWAVAW